ncbi:helix-turn-helix domain-containing protein [Mycobacterium sp. 1245801.1]|uniref:helix-turn-helix domain-containing protein n=1 Tax=Mycobacterium sp. 1245801.1 TaxID=1834075 RepID=UPI000801049D|nr:helix-turn-helix domain-containing protein [Mycobacterium sp. 1245801.1]OBJ24617.1 hypothetical protein A5622_11615 [Mycobacterium sp. 1245801.1]
MSYHDPAVVAWRREQVIALTKQGRTAREIAEHLGISMRSVGRHRVAADVAQPMPRPLTGRELLRATELLGGGASYAEVARTLGRSDTTLRRQLPGYKWDRRQAAEAAALARAMNRLEKQAPVAAATGGRSNVKGSNAA